MSIEFNTMPNNCYQVHQNLLDRHSKKILPAFVYKILQAMVPGPEFN